MKKIAIIAFLLAGCVAAGRALLCRQGLSAHGAGAGPGAGTAVLLPRGAGRVGTRDIGTRDEGHRDEGLRD